MSTKQQLEADRQKHLDALADIDRKIAELPKERKWKHRFQLSTFNGEYFASTLNFAIDNDRNLFDEWALMTMKAMVEKWKQGDVYFYIHFSCKVSEGLLPMTPVVSNGTIFNTQQEAEHYVYLCKQVAEMADRHLVEA